jgi:acyl-CoA synthetase (AMP-forming)/AMP-acid ligase II
VLAHAARFAHALGAAGIGRGNVVALHMPNCIEYPIAYYGTLLAGAVFSPANPLLPPADLAFQLNDCRAAAVVTSGTAAAVVAAVREQIPAKLVVGVDAGSGTADVAFEGFLAGHPTEPPMIDIDVRADLAHLPTPAAPRAAPRASSCRPSRNCRHTIARSRGERSTANSFGRSRAAHASLSAATARYAARPPWRATSREITDESRPRRSPISLYSKPSARPRDISSRSANINITRTAGILSHRTHKIKCFDWLSSGFPCRCETVSMKSMSHSEQPTLTLRSR